MAALTSDSLKAYVGGGKTTAAEGFVLITVTHNLLTKSRFFEIPFRLDWTMAQVKHKIYQMTGTSVDTMQLRFKGQMVQFDTTKLGFFSPVNGDVMQCIDTDENSNAKDGGLDDETKCVKYEISDADYDKLENTYRAHKRRMLAEDPNWKSVMQKNAEEAKKKGRDAERGFTLPEEPLATVQARIVVGTRCEVFGGRRGEVMFVGLVPEIKLSGEDGDVVWVGVKFDEPLGKNDGSVKGVKYFDAGGAKMGGFQRAQMVKTGDYPIVDEMDDLTDSDVDEEL